MNLKSFSLKFIDIMIGVVLGLGFQWWTELTEPWQFIAFIFVYLDIVDFWIDYSPSLRKWPPKKEIDIFLDLGIVFSLFFYIYSVQISLVYFISAFIALRILDFFWLLSSNLEYRPRGKDGLFIKTWISLDLVEVIGSLILLGIHYLTPLSYLSLLILFIFFRILVRIFASTRYKMIHFS